MTTSLSNHDPAACPVDGFEGYPHDEGTPYEARLRGLSHQQLADRLKWLSWYQPGIFTALMDYMEFSDNLAADTDPTNPAPTLTLTLTTDLAVTTLRCSLGHGSQVVYLVAEEGLGPVRDVAVLVDEQLLDLDLALTRLNEVHGHVVPCGMSLGDPALDTAQESIAVRFNQQLRAVRLHRGEQSVAQRRLGGGLQVTFRVVEVDWRSRC